MRFVSEQRQAGEERLVNHHREHTTAHLCAWASFGVSSFGVVSPR